MADIAQSGEVQGIQARDGMSTSRLAVVFVAVAAVLTAQAWLASLALMTGYLALLWYEQGAELLPRWYGVMRRNLTLGVVLAHGLFFTVQSVQMTP